MEVYSLPATPKTPAVRFDPAAGLLDLSGCSIHENADRFYQPLMDRLEAYAKHPAASTTVRVQLVYFNSSSAKYLLDMLRILDEVHASGSGKVTLEWLYDEGDLDMEEAGRDYKALLEMPVQLIAN